MSFSHSKQKHIEKPAADTVIRICMDSNPCCNFISNLKSYTGNIFCKSVWIFLHDIVKIWTIFGIYLHCKAVADPILGQKDHCLAKFFLFFHLNCNLSCFPLTDSFDFSQSFRFFFHNTKCICTEFFYDSCRQRFSHTFDCSTAKISLNCHNIFRRTKFIRGHLQLCSIHWMFHILTFQTDKITFIKITKHTRTGHLFLAIYQFKNRITIFCISKDNVFYIPFHKIPLKLSIGAQLTLCPQTYLTIIRYYF